MAPQFILATAYCVQQVWRQRGADAQAGPTDQEMAPGRAQRPDQFSGGQPLQAPSMHQSERPFPWLAGEFRPDALQGRQGAGGVGDVGVPSIHAYFVLPPVANGCYRSLPHVGPGWESPDIPDIPDRDINSVGGVGGSSCKASSEPAWLGSSLTFGVGGVGGQRRPAPLFSACIGRLDKAQVLISVVTLSRAVLGHLAVFDARKGTPHLFAEFGVGEGLPPVFSTPKAVTLVYHGFRGPVLDLDLTRFLQEQPRGIVLDRYRSSAAAQTCEVVKFPVRRSRSRPASAQLRMPGSSPASVHQAGSSIPVRRSASGIQTRRGNRSMRRHSRCADVNGKLFKIAA